MSTHLEWRRAADLVLHDVDAILGPDAVRVAFRGEPRPGWIGPPWGDVPGVVAVAYLADDPSVGTLPDAAGLPWPDRVVMTAETIQELVMESARYFGAAFPPCKEHPGTPLWPQNTNDEPCWICIDGGTTVVPIGSWPA